MKLLLTIILLAATSVSAAEGYYKTFFLDAGIGLDSVTVFPAADSLGLSWEFTNSKDILRQDSILLGSAADENGALLYPDGQPRFAALVIADGSAGVHGMSLKEKGRDNIREFYNNGGSIIGSGAAAFLSSLGYKNTDTVSEYLHLWGAFVKLTGVPASDDGSPLSISSVDNSPLNKYFEPGQIGIVDDIFLNGGCLPNYSQYVPEETEILFTYFNTDYQQINSEPAVWAYKKNDQSGRLLLCVPKSELENSDLIHRLRKALLLYALEGCNPLNIKDTLLNNTTRHMSKSSSDNDPKFTRIGDGQYHHYYFHVPMDAEDFTLSLEHDAQYSMSLFVNRNKAALIDDFYAADSSADTLKEIFVDENTGGHWYVSVLCNTAVEAEKTNVGFVYADSKNVLNGAPYSLNLQISNPVSVHDFAASAEIKLYPQPCSDYLHVSLTESFHNVRISVFSLSGELLLSDFFEGSEQCLSLSDLAPGVYTLIINSAEHYVAAPFLKI